MRKLGLIAATAAASIGVAGVAQAIDVDQGLKVKTTGSAKGTAKAPKTLKLNVTTLTSAKDPTQNGTYATKSAVIHFDKNLKFNSKSFPTCDLQTVASSPENCPAGSLVGTGYAKATIGAQQIKANPTIQAYNGPGGTLQLKLIKAANEVDSSGVLTGTIKKDTGKYGNKLVVPIPPKLQNQLGLNITLTEFNTVIKAQTSKGKGKDGAKGKGNGYVESIGCGKTKKYNFGGDFVFSDNSTAKVTTTSKC